MKTPFFYAAFTILRKDLRAEFRSRELLSSMGLFAFLAILVFSFALELNRTVRQEVISGVLWVTIIFAVILGLNRSMVNEREQGSMDAMLIAPIDRASIFVGKMLANFIFALTVGVILLPVMTILYNITLFQPLLVVILLLGTLGFSAIGTLLSAMTVQTRSRETLLPIIMLPAALPVLLAVVRASNGVILDQPADLWGTWLGTLLVIDLMYILMCFVLFPFVVED